MKKNVLPTLIGALILILALLLFREPDTSNQLPKSKLVIGDTEISVEIAETPEAMRLGLGNRDSLPENEGMLFPNKIKSPSIFWMKEMRFPLDIIWISDGKIVQINKDVPDEPGVPDNLLIRYPSNQLVDSVLEVNAGFSETHGIKIGDTVNLER